MVMLGVELVPKKIYCIGSGKTQVKYVHKSIF